ncbi:MAG: ABC transporter permease [Anaerolineales bacterium]|nr:ABC transporter permease [Anaerolineales bacterium]
MKIGQLILEALESLSANKMRTSLTMLGIIIGVAAVVAMLAIGTGTQNAITDQISSIGVNLLYVMSGGDADNPQALTLGDAKALASSSFSDSIAYVAPILQGQMNVSVPGESTFASIVAVTPTFFNVQTVDLTEGQKISQANVDNYDAVLLIGSETAEDLFGTIEGLVGKTVRLNNQVFNIIGVIESEGGSGMGSMDNRVIVPLTTAKVRLLKRDEPGQVDMLYVQATNSEQMDAAEEAVSQVLRARHTRSLGEDDFSVMSTQSLLEIASSITGIMTAFLGGIAGISLLVGGIGIMNIMLVSVTERTREIGLRMAIGARRSDVRIQFLVESALISLTGGLVGVALGWALAQLIGILISTTGDSITPAITMNSVLLATLFSAAIGLFFGIYPANRAAMLEPVEALRTE